MITESWALSIPMCEEMGLSMPGRHQNHLSKGILFGEITERWELQRRLSEAKRPERFTFERNSVYDC